VKLIRRAAEVLDDQGREDRYQNEEVKVNAATESDLVAFEPHPGDLSEGTALRWPGTCQHSLRDCGFGFSASLRR
jgi:hypothetical protein